MRKSTERGKNYKQTWSREIKDRREREKRDRLEIRKMRAVCELGKI
jgi:hypothetical protein